MTIFQHAISIFIIMVCSFFSGYTFRGFELSRVNHTCVLYCARNAEEGKFGHCVEWCKKTKCRNDACLDKAKDVCLCCYMGTC